MRHIRSILVLIVAFLALLPDTGIASSLHVTWNADTDSDLAGYKVYYGTQSNTYGTPASVTSGTSYDLTSVQAGTTYYVAVSAYDSSGNESVKSTQQSVTIPAADTTPPSGSVVINSGAVSTTSTSVTLTLNATDASGTVTGMMFSNDGTTWSSEITYATSYSWTLSSGFGAKTVYAKFKDNSGNWMTSPATATISYVDTTAPTGSIVINSGATSTSSTTVTLTLSATDNSGSVSSMKFSNDGTTYSSEVTYATSYSWTLSSTTGTKTVYAKFKDSAGNWSSAASDTIQLTDTTAPTGSVVINSGASTTTSTAVTLTLSASDASGSVAGMKFSNDGTTYSSEVTYASSYSWTLTSGVGSKTVYAMFKDSSGNWSSAVSDTIQLVDSTPVAEAGSNQNVVPQRVILDGTASYDPSGQTLSYSWSQVSGTTVIIESPTSSTASFLGIKAGTYQFKLICTNGTGSSSDTVSVTIQNVAPTVDAGSNRTIYAGTAITLHATGQDSNEDTLSYQWTKVSGSSVTLPSLAQQDITFTPTIAGQYTFSVACSDGTNTSAASQVIVTVNSVNTAPTANAGVEQDVTKGSTVTLDGTGSTDPDGDTLSYSWTQASSDAVKVTLSGATASKPTFVASTVGTYNFSLTVNDGKVNSTASSVIVKVVAQNNPPVANAGSDKHAYVGDDVVLDASGSYDSDLDGLTYAWTQVSGATVAIFNANTISAFFTPTTSGTYEFKVTVSDGQSTSTDNVIVTVDNANQVPIANAGSSTTATVGSTVTLDGSASYDPDGSTISYIWSQSSGTQVSLSSSNTAKPSFVASKAGVYVFQLKVYDGTDTSSASSVTVTAQSSTNQVTLVSPVNATVCYSSPTLKWAGSGFKSYIAYISIDGGKNYSKVYSGGSTSTTLHAVLWQWFIPKGTTVTWYVQGTTSSGTTVKSSTSTFKKN